MRGQLALLVLLTFLLAALLLAGCGSRTYTGEILPLPVAPGTGLFFGGPLLSTITVTVTPAGRTIDLGDGHRLVFDTNAVLNNTQVRITRLGSAGANGYWSMFTPQYEIDVLSGGQAGGGVVDLVLSVASLNQANHNMWLTGVYRWTRFVGQIQIASGPARTAADLARWMPLSYHIEGEPNAISNIEAHLDLVGAAGAAGTAGTGAGRTIIPTGPTFTGIAPTNVCAVDRVPPQWMAAPAAPAGYRYVGFTIVVNKVCEETSFDLERDPQPTDINIIHSSTTVQNAVTTEDIIVAHTFEPIPTER